MGRYLLLADAREEVPEQPPRCSETPDSRWTSPLSTSRRAGGRGARPARDSTRVGDRLIHAAGVSPSQATPEVILRVDLYGTAMILEGFGSVIVSGGSGVVIASQSGHRLPPLSVEQNKALATAGG